MRLQLNKVPRPTCCLIGVLPKQKVSVDLWKESRLLRKLPEEFRSWMQAANYMAQIQRDSARTQVTQIVLWPLDAATSNWKHHDVSGYADLVIRQIKDPLSIHVDKSRDWLPENVHRHIYPVGGLGIVA